MTFRAKSTDLTIMDSPNSGKDLLCFWAHRGQRLDTLHGFAVAENMIRTMANDIDAVQNRAALDGSRQ